MVGDIFQPTHLLFVLVVALLVLGPKRLPEVGRTLGSGIRDFRQALSGETHDPPQRQDSEQVATTELRHQPDVVAENNISWPEEAVDPTSFDEPVEAATAEPATAVVTNPEPATAVVADPEPATAAMDPEPATAVVTDPEPAESAADDRGDTGDASDPRLTDEAHSDSAPAHDEAPAPNLSFYEHALARRVSESGSDSPGSHTDQSS
jgi:sec-independent protein translocase protein TatA